MCLSCEQQIGNGWAYTGLYNGDPLCELCSDVEYLRVCIERYQPSQSERRVLRLGIRVLIAQALGSHNARLEDTVAAAEADEAAAAAAGPPEAATAPTGEAGGASEDTEGGQPSASATWLTPEAAAEPAGESSTTTHQ